MDVETEKCEEATVMARTTKATFAQQKIWCIVSQRDDVSFSFKFKDDVKGQDVMDEVCDRLGIIEKDYFGFQYTNSRGEVHWLNMRNRISRQLNKPEPYSLLFCVKFYVPPHQLLQDSSRRQFFLNAKHDLLSGKYQANEETLIKLHALLAQAESGKFRENHISYNPSRTLSWSPDVRSKVILEHCKLNDMAADVAEYYCLKEVAELEDYGMEYYNVKSEDNANSMTFGIGTDCLKIERGNNIIQRVPYTCLHMATHSGKTVKVDLYTTDLGDVESVIYRLNSKEAACALYRSITEHHAFYRSDSIRPAVKEQVARDFFDTVLSWFHDDNNSDQNYIFDTERTCKEAYDNARRILYNFGTTTAAAMPCQTGMNDKSFPVDKSALEEEISNLTDSLFLYKESFNCLVCRDNIVDTVLQCGHLVCSMCSDYCDTCPLCRASITSKTKCYLPINVSGTNEKGNETGALTTDCEI